MSEDEIRQACAKRLGELHSCPMDNPCDRVNDPRDKMMRDASLLEWNNTSYVSKAEMPTVEPHEFKRRGWRFWICDLCFAPKELHPRVRPAYKRGPHENCYISASAPHFEPAWSKW